MASSRTVAQRPRREAPQPKELKTKEGKPMLAFLGGAMLGGAIGVVTMCLMQINRGGYDE